MARIRYGEKAARGGQFNRNKKILLAEHKCCELCGRDYLPLNVHHKIPVMLGGSDDMANLIVVCERCHALLHAGTQRPSSEGLLTPAHPYMKRYIRLIDFIGIIYKMSNEPDTTITTGDMIDLAVYLSGIKTERNVWCADYCMDTVDGPMSKEWNTFTKWALMRQPDFLRPMKED